jgi:outer membrane protein assembly factor BamB
VYVAGDAATSYEPPAESVGVRAYPLTPPAVCATPPPSPWPYSPISCPLWTTPTAAAPVTSPVLAPGEATLYVGTADGTLLALDPSDGHELWRAALGAAPSGDPALAAGWLYVPLANSRLVVLPAGGCGEPTCRPTWRAELGSAALQPAVAGGIVFVGTTGGRALAFAAEGCGRRRCRPLWQRDMGGAVTGAPAVTGGRVYLGVAPDRLVALAPS